MKLPNQDTLRELIQKEVDKDGLMYKSYWYIKALSAEEILSTHTQEVRERVKALKRPYDTEFFEKEMGQPFKEKEDAEVVFPDQYGFNQAVDEVLKLLEE